MTKKKIATHEERYPVIEEGSSISPPSAIESEFRWTASQLGAFKDAPTGNHKAWKIIYALAASFARDGMAMPEPLSTIMAERLQAISNVLSNPRVKDARAAYPDAITGTERKRGRRPKMLSLTEKMAEEVLLQAMYYALPSKLVPKVTEILKAMPNEALPFAALIVEYKHIDVAIADMMGRKFIQIPINTITPEARKLRDTLRKTG